MRKVILHSLAAKIGSIVILIEILVLSIIGGFYINRFSREIDRRIEDRVHIPGSLMAEGSLRYSLVANRQWMERLVGQELVEGMVLSVAQRVFYTLDPETMGKSVADMPGLNPDWFNKDLTEPFVEHIVEGQKKYLISVTPVFTLDGRTPFLFVYLKVDTTHAAEKAAITRLFLFGSVAAILVTSIAIFLIFEFSIFTRIQSLLLLFKRVEGGDLTVRTTDRIVPDEIGSLQYGVNSMIGELQGMLTALRESRKRYQAVVGDIPAMVCRFLPDGTLTFLNNECSRYFKTCEEDLIGQNFFQYFPKNDRGYVKQQFQSLSPDHPITTYTLQAYDADGRVCWQQWIGRGLFSEQGDVNEYQALGRDITDEIQAQEEKADLQKQLQQAQKMEAIGTLAGGIAHDFNNILGGIIGYAELTQDELPPEMRSQHYLNQILKACQRAKELIIQILTFSRQSPVERQPLELTSILKETLKLLKATLPDNIDVRYSFHSPSNMVLANPTQIHQTLMNLCTNAIHAMKDSGGLLEVEVREVDITGEHPNLYPNMHVGTYIILSIRDTGPGMTDETLQRIFDPYFTTQTPYEGTGLGLSICLGIVENHGGTISVESSPGKGSTFTVFFPKLEGEFEIQDENAQIAIYTEHGHERILFIDDEAFLVEIGQEMLEQLGYDVATEMDSLKALERFQAQPEEFDLVITDQTMPKMTGAELATKLLEIRADIPIILCTGFSEVITEGQAKALGIREFILKPLSRQEMNQAIRNVLDATRKPE